MDIRQKLSFYGDFIGYPIFGAICTFPIIWVQLTSLIAGSYFACYAVAFRMAAVLRPTLLCYVVVRVSST